MPRDLKGGSFGAVSAARPHAFTLIELLVVIAIIAILASLLLPVLSTAKAKAQTVRCASNMKNWDYATIMYLGEYEDRLPLFGESSTDYSKPFWFEKLAPYLARQVPVGQVYDKTAIFNDELRKCPGGSYGPVPFSKATPGAGTWNCWIGANFGAGRNPLSGPFYYGDTSPPLNVAIVRHPSQALLFTDTITHYVYSPVDPAFKFTMDADHDGVLDTWGAYPDAPFNWARPTVHAGGANLALLDGHLQRVSFKTLWQTDNSGNMVSQFWYGLK